MKLPDLPKPDYRSPGDGFHWRRTDNQVRAIQREAYIAGMEEAAKLAAATVCDTHLPTGVKIYGTRAGAAIRALAQNIRALKGELDE